MTTTATERSNWTAAGSDTSAQRTYASVRKALADIERRRNVEIFLQGSYANSTNVRADSDVDIVVMTKRTYQGSYERLGDLARARWDNLPAGTFHAADLRAEVEQALVDYYGSSRVEPKNKCIKVRKTEGYVDADVVPCLQYRHYEKSNPNLHTEYIEGVSLKPLSGGRIINFPKEHIKWGQAKNDLCSGNYKKTVRQIKRLRTRAVDNGLLPSAIAPGYLLECMTFNAPHDHFVNNDSDRLINVLAWLKVADKGVFNSCDLVHKLFIDDPGNFNVDTGQRITDALWETL